MSVATPEAAGSLHRLPLAGPGGAAEPLALRHAEPPADRDRGLSILYLHGFGSSQRGEKATWFRRWAAEEGIAFTSFDFRGHGESGGELGELTLTRNLADAGAALAWLAGHRPGPIVLFGSSMGAAAAMWLTVEPETPGGGTAVPDAPAGSPLERIAGVLAVAPALTMERSLADRCGPEGLARWRETGRLRVETELMSTELYWELMEDLARHPPERLAERYAAPTLVFQGMRDESVAWRDVAAFAAAARPARLELHLFAAGDHRLIAQRERIAELAGGWLAGLPRRAAPGPRRSSVRPPPAAR